MQIQFILGHKKHTLFWIENDYIYIYIYVYWILWELLSITSNCYSITSFLEVSKNHLEEIKRTEKECRCVGMRFVKLGQRKTSDSTRLKMWRPLRSFERRIESFFFYKKKVWSWRGQIKFEKYVNTIIALHYHSYGIGPPWHLAKINNVIETLGGRKSIYLILFLCRRYNSNN